jgi:hypothetical protein
MEHSLCLEANTGSAAQEIPRFLSNLKVLRVKDQPPTETVWLCVTVILLIS